jgi:hypothetical protein
LLNVIPLRTWPGMMDSIFGANMKTLQERIPSKLIRYSVIGIFYGAVLLLSFPVGNLLGRQLFLLTH